MTEAQQREAARQFYYRWMGKGREDEDARSYWIEILSDVLGVEDVTKRVDFEKKVVGPDGNTKRIDVYIPETHVLIEQKSLGIALDKPQAGHNGMTPYEQAKMYDNGLPHSEKARWIVTSNFAEVWIYDMEERKPEDAVIKLTLLDLPSKYHMLDFLVKKEVKKVSDEMAVSLQAGEIVGVLYDAFLKQYKDPEKEETLKSLNKLCVRIVFLLYGEDAGVLGRKGMFHDYMEQFDAQHARKGLRDLFRVLNQKPEDRDEFLADDDPLLAEFPYVNGGLFDGDDIEIPPFTDEIMDLLLRKASDDFDWSGISPTIFGAVFESTLNPETRRSGGMHYTSLENIHKVIDPLFLDDLKAELEEIKKIDVWRTKKRRLESFQDKLASLTFLDPAAGSGNFLTESYKSLRELENDAIRELTGGQMTMGEVINPIKVSISQFYGIEINDFAVTVARTALWIAENQMMKQTEDIVHMSIDFLPLKTNASIVEGNALRIDWESVVDKRKLNYIMGNPPFVGMKEQSNEQKADLKRVINVKTLKQMDYVAGWYYKAAQYMEGTAIESAFVSSNSITQGEQALTIWEPLMKRGIVINFAYRTFVWDSEANDKAHVHCVIIGFSYKSAKNKTIIEGDTTRSCTNINQYLTPGQNIFIKKSGKPIFDVPEMTKGAQLIDDGHFFIGDEKAYQDSITKEPQIKPYIRKYMHGRALLNGEPVRYVLYLEDCPPGIMKNSPLIRERVQAVYEFRANNTSPSTNVLKDRPSHYFQAQAPSGKCIVLPAISSGNRRYIPMSFLDEEMVIPNTIFYIDNATLYHFGVLMSNVHMSWVRTVCGRLKSDYRYSNTMAYNTFPWPNVTKEQEEKIRNSAQNILKVRERYNTSTLADLYDPTFMPDDLRKAHTDNDRAVMQAYGMPIKETDEAACVAWLMRLYQEKVAELEKGKK